MAGPRDRNRRPLHPFLFKPLFRRYSNEIVANPRGRKWGEIPESGLGEDTNGAPRDGVLSESENIRGKGLSLAFSGFQGVLRTPPRKRANK